VNLGFAIPGNFNSAIRRPSEHRQPRCLPEVEFQGCRARTLAGAKSDPTEQDAHERGPKSDLLQTRRAEIPTMKTPVTNTAQPGCFVLSAESPER